jgi:tetratricopeptide (TPR) repeat protein
MRHWPLVVVYLVIALPHAASGQQLPAASELQFEPDRPVAGATVRVSYRSPEATTERLVLRARLRTPRHDSYNRWLTQATVAELRRVADGAYEGQFRLPPDVVFGVFAVETPGSDWADDNEGRPWELVIHGADGRPLYDALVQRVNDYMGRDVREVVASARRAVELYPDIPRSWALLRTAESWNQAAAAPGDAERWRARTDEVVARIGGRGDLSADEMSDLVWLTWGTPAANEWRGRLDREHPDHPWAVIQRMREGQQAHSDDREALLALYDDTWRTLETRGCAADVREEQERISLAATALRLALAAGAPDALSGPHATWLDRFRTVAPPDRQADVLLGDPRLLEPGLEAARREVERIRALRPEDRLLGWTLDQQRRSQQLQLGRVKRAMGEALVAAGRTGQGAALLREAVALSPSGALLRALGEAEVALGDTAAALAAWAAASAHPPTTAAFADTVRERLGEAFHAERWQELRSSGWEELLRVTRDEAVRRTVPELVLATSARDSTTLTSLLHGSRGAVAVFVSRTCTGSMATMPRIQDMARRMAERGITVVAITKDEVAEDYLEAYHEIGVDLPIYHDVTGDAGHAFNTWHTPDYYVLDHHGAIRFEHTDVVAIGVQLEALRGEVPHVQF